ncbi:DUF4031 domain-containing protein [Occallatibacter riparius]|uniref:DUF4031 domain-containing protein n=1 Tax=Occallatibacter riparius TaxID=1002689 RepID=A0A9J7BP25_9BACT|nr:DUF4031 domain-containing protein [Occallatibacter riparius]UWZ84636.1 DUF4031 domain-containing protein [Occallatibacter riparius]
MAVYVDDMQAPFGRMVMCHMIADTSTELREMARRVGVAARWIQYADTWKEHFDICKSKRELAISFGAIAITTRELAAMGYRPYRARSPESHNSRGANVGMRFMVIASSVRGQLAVPEPLDETGQALAIARVEMEQRSQAQAHALWNDRPGGDPTLPMRDRMRVTPDEVAWARRILACIGEERFARTFSRI